MGRPKMNQNVTLQNPQPNAQIEPNANKRELSDIEKRLRKTNMNHVYHFDVNADGRMKEVAVVKIVKNQDTSIQSVYYIDVASLDAVDKGRLKSVIVNRHADKYELWDLLSQTNLSNGKNALDYFHQLTKVAHGKNSVNTQLMGGLAGVAVESNAMVGSNFTDTSSATFNE